MKRKTVETRMMMKEQKYKTRGIGILVGRQQSSAAIHTWQERQLKT
jgi:hypothetical protein